MRRLRQFLKDQYTRLLQIRDTPHAIAGGLAIGVFFGMTPLVGLKTLLALGTAYFLRCSKISAVIAVTLHDVLIPIAPIIFRWQYQLGYWLLSAPHRLPPPFRARHLHMNAWLDWKTLKVLWPTFVGSLLMAIPLAIITYFVALKIVERSQRARRVAEAGTASTPPHSS